MNTIASSTASCSGLPEINSNCATAGLQETSSEAVAQVLINGGSSKSITGTVVLPVINDPTIVPPPSAAHTPPLTALPHVEFGQGTTQHRVDAQCAQGAPQTVRQGDPSALLASMRKTQQDAVQAAQNAVAASNVLPFVAEKVVDAEARRDIELLYQRISKRYIKFTGDGPPKVFNIDTGEFMSRDSFFEFLKDSPEYGTVNIGDDERPRWVSCGEPWWNWTMTHKVVADRIVMEPTGLSRAEERTAWENTPNHGTYNRWHDLIRGRVVPDMNATMDDIKPLTNHLLMLSGQEPQAVEHFMCQLAQIYQFPQHKLRTANFWYSRCNFVGKSMLIDLLKAVFGGSPLVDECDGASLGDKFTALLKDGLIRMFNEVPIMDAARFDTTKTLVSEKTRKSENKGKDAGSVKNFINLILTSNNSQALPLALGDPRFNVFRYEGERMPSEYYRAFDEWLKGPGPALVAGCLAKFVFPRDWDVKAGGRWAPQTDAAKALQQEARGNLVNFIDGLIADRAPPFDKPIGRPRALAEQLATTYPANCRNMQVHARTVADALRKLGAVPIGSGTASENNAMCWRNQEKWTAVRLKSWKAYLDGNGPCPVPDEDNDDE